MTPHQKAIEAAAKARWAFHAPSTHWTDLPTKARERLINEERMVNAAFLASARESGWEMKLREPSEGMIDEGADELTDGKKWARQIAPTDIWQKMFDAAPRFEDAQ